MKNKLQDLNDHLFAQMERLSEEGMSAEQIEQESKRADSMVSVADQIIRNADLTFKAATFVATHGDRYRPALSGLIGKPVTVEHEKE
ncbi:hypothetical protein ATL17_1629 [Maritalea mobilis]|uniref:Uncharacterized protein n=1 Tax=Maritalea mobilis TaxID=483324 RepID=A0A4R6VN51_9HYPH|nr:hypothetical protein [Maritalea mobilis]TDQ63622.1 hypothetical protein ATL17_1629 [Maritalea mobilis]